LESLNELDFDIDLTGFSIDDIAPEETEGLTDEVANGSLAEKFGIAPFSVLNAREGWWQNRKRAWLAMGIKSELGRGENGHNAAPGG
jgi:hypothetical protein